MSIEEIQIIRTGNTGGNLSVTSLDLRAPRIHNIEHIQPNGTASAPISSAHHALIGFDIQADNLCWAMALLLIQLQGKAVYSNTMLNGNALVWWDYEATAGHFAPIFRDNTGNLEPFNAVGRDYNSLWFVASYEEIMRRTEGEGLPNLAERFGADDHMAEFRHQLSRYAA